MKSLIKFAGTRGTDSHWSKFTEQLSIKIIFENNLPSQFSISTFGDMLHNSTIPLTNFLSQTSFTTSIPRIADQSAPPNQKLCREHVAWGLAHIYEPYWWFANFGKSFACLVIDILPICLIYWCWCLRHNLELNRKKEIFRIKGRMELPCLLLNSDKEFCDWYAARVMWKWRRCPVRQLSFFKFYSFL